MKRFIAIAGNIGSGKTTLAKKIAERKGFHKYEEFVEGNPYLPLFYEDMPRWSYHLQRFFLFTRAVMHEQSALSPEDCVLDRTLYEDKHIFAQQQINSGLWTPDQIHSYNALYNIILKDLLPPHLLIYMRTEVPTLRERIARRGMPYERELTKPDDTYLPALQRLYEDWFAGYGLSPKIAIKTDALNLRDNDGHIDEVIAEIERTVLQGRAR